MKLTGNISNTLPIIEYDEMDGNINISGRSTSSEIDEYFDKFLLYFKRCISNYPQDLNVVIDLEYFNTKAARKLMDFLKTIKEKVSLKNYKTNIIWFYENGDDDMKETAEDFKLLSNLEIEIKEKEVKDI